MSHALGLAALVVWLCGSSSIDLPARDVVKVLDVVMVEHLLQELLRVVHTIFDELTSPRNEPAPIRFVKLEEIRIRDCTVLRQGDELLGISELVKLVVLRRDRL